MIPSKQKRTYAVAGVVALAAVAILGAGASEPAQAADAVGVDTSAQTLSIAELEARLKAQGIEVTEMEIEGLLLEVEGLDAEGREVELVLDRRSGELLSKKFDR